MKRHNRVKLLLCGINFAPELTGIGKYSSEMAFWLTKQGHEVRVVTAPPYYPAWKVRSDYSAARYRRENIKGVDIWRCPLYVPTQPSGLKRILHLVSFALTSLPVMLRQIFWRPDVVLVIEPSLFCAPTSWLAARLAGGKCWLHVQDFEVDAAFEMAILRSSMIQRIALAFEKFLMRRFHRVSTISKRMMERLAAKGVADRQRVFFPNWVDIQEIYPLKSESKFRVELNIQQDSVVALYAGNLGEKQGLEILIEAAKLTEKNTHIVWVIAGEGSSRACLEKLSERLQNVMWLPLQPLENLNALLNLADIHLLPQKADAADLVMPSKLTGMLASGRPVVATAATGTQVSEVVADCGIVVPPGDVRGLTEAVQNLAEDTDRRLMLGRAARRYAELHLDKDVIMAKFESDGSKLINK